MSLLDSHSHSSNHKKIGKEARHWGHYRFLQATVQRTKSKSQLFPACAACLMRSDTAGSPDTMLKIRVSSTSSKPSPSSSTRPNIRPTWSWIPGRIFHTWTKSSFHELSVDFILMTKGWHSLRRGGWHSERFKVLLVHVHTICLKE